MSAQGSSEVGLREPNMLLAGFGAFGGLEVGATSRTSEEEDMSDDEEGADAVAPETMLRMRATVLQNLCIVLSINDNSCDESLIVFCFRF